jgi:hypothetical protein
MLAASLCFQAKGDRYSLLFCQQRFAGSSVSLNLLRPRPPLSGIFGDILKSALARLTWHHLLPGKMGLLIFLETQLPLSTASSVGSFVILFCASGSPEKKKKKKREA